MKYTKDDLRNFQPRFDFLVGIDSDGCVFDTMGVKQIEFFHPLILEVWDLWAIEKPLREVAEFVNIYSTTRGTNRYLALLRMFDLLTQRDDVRQSGVKLPDTDDLRGYVESGLPLSLATLRQEAERTGSVELARLLKWSLAVNRKIDEEMESIPPFAGVVECLEQIRAAADAIVISQTPEEALVKEWEMHGLAPMVGLIAGQELGTKAEHLTLVTQDRYDKEKVILLGDAPGDRRAAEDCGVLFYPIIPGDEVASWQQFADEAFDRFLAGTFAGDYQSELCKAFEASLPENPPW